MLRITAYLLLLTLSPAFAAKPPSRGIVLEPASSASESRIALVIGNGTYKDAPLKNPVNDARAMARSLRECGFQVDLVLNANRTRMFQAVREFGVKLQGGGVGLFYYAGHGMAVKGTNYLIPVGTDITAEDEVEVQALSVQTVLNKMESAKNRLNLLVLDACRNNPFIRSFRSGNRGLTQMDAPAGSFIAYATAPGSTAADGTGENGLYTQHLLKALRQPGLSVEQVFKRVRVGVKQDSKDQQVPWDSSSLTGDFYFLPSDAPPETRPQPEAPILPKEPAFPTKPAVWRSPLVEPANTETLPEVDRIVARHLQALGGAAALNTVHSFRCVTRTEGTGSQPLRILHEIGKDGSYRTENSGMSSSVAVYREDRGWFQFGKNPPQTTGREKVLLAARSEQWEGSLARYRERGDSLVLVGREALEGRDMLKLRLKRETPPNTQDILIWIDAETHLVRRMLNTVFQNRKKIDEYDCWLEDYREIDGIKVPHRTRAKTLANQTYTTLVESIEFNPEIDPARFEMPKP
ncbi:caspase family protein [Holophaga foetida]|uniref:caspase family protein n=1 Tax=Holophaga foetida TaxID=35839 RepID=UPI000247219C|nr:caspase family protein [Holophaga foetida]